MTTDNAAQFRTLVDLGVRAALVLALAAWCFQIVLPFVPLLLWGGIIAVALAPVYERLRDALGGRDGPAAAVFILACLGLLIVPTVVLSSTLVDSGTRLAEALRSGSLQVPAPPDSVAEWPLIGERLHAFWGLAASNLESAVEQLAPHLRPVATWLLKQLAGGGFAILQLALSVVVAGLFLANAQTTERAVGTFLARITDERSINLRRLCVATVRSVAQGVLGIAIAQGLLAGLGMLAAGVPGAGLWALLVMLVAIVQLPPLLILGPIIVYVFAVESTTVAVVFAVWSAAVSFSDGILKPLLLGRGTGVPMLVILLGAIGGLMASGLIGLFLGAVLLAVGYELFRAWLYREGDPAAAAVADAQPPNPAGPGSADS